MILFRYCRRLLFFVCCCCWWSIQSGCLLTIGAGIIEISTSQLSSPTTHMNQRMEKKPGNITSPQVRDLLCCSQSMIMIIILMHELNYAWDILTVSDWFISVFSFIFWSRWRVQQQSRLQTLQTVSSCQGKTDEFISDCLTLLNTNLSGQEFSWKE